MDHSKLPFASIAKTVKLNVQMLRSAFPSNCLLPASYTTLKFSVQCSLDVMNNLTGGMRAAYLCTIKLEDGSPVPGFENQVVFKSYML